MLLSLGVVFAFIALGWPAFIHQDTQTVRAIDFHESDDIDEKAFQDLVRAAVALTSPGPAADARRPGRGYFQTASEGPPGVILPSGHSSGPTV